MLFSLLTPPSSLFRLIFLLSAVATHNSVKPWFTPFLLQAEINQLRFRVKALQETNEILRNRNVDLMAKAIGSNGLPASSPTDENGASSDG
ncbi:unnamed protein product [Cylicostephanus goldi]|uniref:Uncharacterized protein n=1 Tax=Cylicostephanus goldi TaxID=71465 RepID=A0A3P7QNY9_CYLGO|nr:unnamed protein product [Cylicostephanus goldi]